MPELELMPLESVCYAYGEAITPLLLRRSINSVRDDIATTAHYYGLDQPIPVGEVIEAPKAKPALAGLGVTTGDRYTGRLTEE